MNGTEGRTQGFAWMIALLALALLALLAPRQAQAADDDGQALFVETGCNKCHSLAALKIEVVEGDDEEEEEDDPFADEEEESEPPDLSGIGASWEHGEDGMAKWLTKKLEIDEKLHKKKFPGSKDQLKALSAWLLTLKEPAPE